MKDNRVQDRMPAERRARAGLSWLNRMVVCYSTVRNKVIEINRRILSNPMLVLEFSVHFSVDLPMS